MGKTCGIKAKEQEFIHVSFDPFVSAGRGLVDHASFIARPLTQAGPNPRILLCLALPFDDKFGAMDEISVQKPVIQPPTNKPENAPQENSTPNDAPQTPAPRMETTSIPLALPERFTYLVGLFECSAPLSRLNLRTRGNSNPIFAYLHRTIQKDTIQVITQKESIAGFLQTFLNT